MHSLYKLELLVGSVELTVQVFRLHPLEILFNLRFANDLVLLYSSG
jgi:hypothetical protein